VQLEARLVLLHAVVGLTFGALIALALGTGGRSTPRRAAAGALIGTLVAYVLALGGMMARYPQIFADRWWLAGGWRAATQRVVTHRLGPGPFDALLVLLLLGLATAAVVRSGLPAIARWRRAITGGLIALVLMVFGWNYGSAYLRAPSSAAPPPPAVLILGVDSLRTDRLESPEIMPHCSALLPEGQLFRHAFTPIARTFPSWVSVLTGLEPRHHRVRTMFPDVESRRDIGPTFVSELRDRGFRTFVVSDFAGDIFPRIHAGFEDVDAPNLTADALAASTVLSAHGGSLPFLRMSPGRSFLHEWRNLASLSDPDWLAEKALAHVRMERGRPFVGVVFFSTAHFPYVAPYPDYLIRGGNYSGPYLYHAPPVLGEREISPADIEQVRARYDGALHAVDRAIGWLIGALRREGRLSSTLVVLMGDHGEELYEEPGIAGHGDVVSPRSQAAPVFLVGPGVDRGRTSDEQVRLHDLAPTVLGWALHQRGRRFGDALDLLTPEKERPVCVETGIWFWPRLPAGLRGRRLQYPGIAELLTIDPSTREIVLRPDAVPVVESAKVRGVVLGARLFTEQLTPEGRQTRLTQMPGVVPEREDEDLARLFEERCVRGDPALSRVLDGVVWARR
jgi:Sulfatase